MSSPCLSFNKTNTKNKSFVKTVYDVALGSGVPKLVATENATHPRTYAYSDTRDQPYILGLIILRGCRTCNIGFRKYKLECKRK